MFGLSRTALLYYDRIGLLSPAMRSEAGYRLYDDDDISRLRLICTYKNAGLPLRKIRDLMDSPGIAGKGVLRGRMLELDEEIASLRVQQRAIVDLLANFGDIAPASSLDKNTWVKILRSSGMDESDMWQWHAEFEQNAPQAHQSFLQWLGIPDEEIREIRKTAGTSSTAR